MNSAIAVRNTANGRGRLPFFTPASSPLRVMSCARIILDRGISRLSAHTGSQEVVLVCLNGTGTVVSEEQQYELRPFDTLYLPPGADYRVQTESEFDLAEASAPCARQTRAQFVPFSVVEASPDLHFKSGSAASERHVFKLIDLNVDASRLLCGLTFGVAGNWTGWSPHEHAQFREEVYLFIRMPAPAFGIQMVYEDLRQLELMLPVFENDAVAITRGYHPNLGAPGFGINYLWIMAGLREDVDRDFTNLRLQPEFVRNYAKESQ